MTENLAIGCAALVVCFVIQCVFVGLLMRGLVQLEQQRALEPTLMWISSALSVVLLVLLAGNLLQMAIWAQLFHVYGEFQDFSTAFYHSAVNFTTLGYGDVVMSPERRLLGALEASNGVLMFGLTTSVLFRVLGEVTRRQLVKRRQPAADRNE